MQAATRQQNQNRREERSAEFDECRACNVKDRSPVRPPHVPDIGAVSIQDDLAAAGDIDSGNLANAATPPTVFLLRKSRRTKASARGQLFEQPTLAGQWRAQLHGLQHRP